MSNIPIGAAVDLNAITPPIQKGELGIQWADKTVTKITTDDVMNMPEKHFRLLLLTLVTGNIAFCEPLRGES